MTLATGIRLGPYEILAPIGAGGMGEVYRASDTRLGRAVAIKVLRSHLSSSAEVRQRFEREARTISQLSHPHICALYDVGREGDVEYLVMELLEGETLSEKIRNGPLPLEQTLRYGTEIAGALDTAHQQGIVHRDLKPGNVMLTKSGVKLLDFGLAKATASLAPQSELTGLPTVAPRQNLTQEGTILGTFQYMAPEQLEGKEADARTDIFAFGTVLYEMATGRKAFSGSSQASLISAIMKEKPAPIAALQPTTPAALDRVVKTCLAKDPEERWQSAADLGRELRWITEVGSQAEIPAPAIERRRRRERFVWAGLLVATVVGVGFLASRLRREPQDLPAIRTTLPLPEGTYPGQVAVSPDGTRLAFTVWGADGHQLLYLRRLDDSTSQAVPATEDAYFPFWSPDGRSIGFFAAGKLKRLDFAGGAILTICDAARGFGGTWNRQGEIVFAPTPTSALYRVSASGGEPVPVTRLDPSRHETVHRFPCFLPDGRHFLYTAADLTAPVFKEAGAIRVGSIDGKEDKALVPVASNVSYAAGRLLYVRDESLVAQEVDLSRLETSGEPVPIVRKIGHFGIAFFRPFSVSESGILIAASPFSPSSRLVWLDRNGKETGSMGEPGMIGEIQLSPDGRRLSAERWDEKESSIWIYDVPTGTGRKFFSDAAGSVWSPDGTRIVFSSSRSRQETKSEHLTLRIKQLDGGTEEVLAESHDDLWPEGWSRDGRFLSVRAILATGLRNSQLCILDMTAKERRYVPFAVDGNHWGSSFSPDGRWIADSSDESGQAEVYVRSFPGPGGKWQVSPAGGGSPRWRGDGKELLYVSLDNKMIAVPVFPGETFHSGPPTPLFSFADLSRDSFDISFDAKRFIVAAVTAGQTSSPLNLVIHWTALLPKH